MYIALSRRYNVLQRGLGLRSLVAQLALRDDLALDLLSDLPTKLLDTLDVMADQADVHTLVQEGVWCQIPRLRWQLT